VISVWYFYLTGGISMVRKVSAFCVLAVGLLVVCGTMYAHHGNAGAYDNSVRITVQATVTDIVWSNPHGQIFFDFKNDKGENEHWGVELLSPGNLVKIGWYKDTFKPGDTILASFTPANGNRPFGACGHIVSSDGKMFYTGQCGVPGGDLTKLPVKAGYTAVEVKFPEFPKPQSGQAEN
jgi:hypothetical protein